MEWLLLAIIIGFVAFRMKNAKGVQTISTVELKEKLNDKELQFIDVRTPAEYKGRHIKQFKNMPLHMLHNQSASLKKQQPVVVICQSGMRSAKAAGQLKKAGFEQVMNVRGGMSAWRE